MVDKISLFKLSELPDSFGVVILVFSFILLLAPYFSGADFGIFRVPIFTPLAKTWLKIIGPVLFGVCVISFLPIIPTNVQKAETIDSIVTEGVERNDMQACPPGYAIGGAIFRRPRPSTLLCLRVLPVGEEKYETTVVDTSTRRNNMHACPVGMYMIGIHLGSDNWLCGYDSRRGIVPHPQEFEDGHPFNSPNQQQGVHACPQTPGLIRYMAGLNEADDRFLCGTYQY